MREGQTEVLVVGAGPIGLWSALCLAEARVQVIVVDRESRIAARNYACALHPSTLKRLKQFGLAEAALERGRRVEKIAFYQGPTRQAEIDLSKASVEYPFLLILPQSALESLLEQRLRQAGVTVEWNHRFDNLVEEQEQVCVTVEELEGTSTGYIVPHWETVVKRRVPIHAQFLIGADGHNSLIRQRLGIAAESLGETEVFAAYEFEAESAGEDELRVVLDQSSTNVLWPLGQNRFRWTFQLTRSDLGAEFPEKERRAVRVEHPSVDERIRQCVERVISHRAPWFKAGVRKITWCTEVSFGHQIVTGLGRNRCWLVGDAAHQTGPVGVQSMNAGFGEAERLTGAIRRILQENASQGLLEVFNRDTRAEWLKLLRIGKNTKVSDDASHWVRETYSRIPACLPGLGQDLAWLAKQLGLEVSS